MFCFSRNNVYYISLFLVFRETFFSLLFVSLSVIVSLMSLLSHGGNFGCFTRLRFKGACLLTTLRYTSYHVAKALSGSVQFRTRVNGAQCRTLKKAALLKCFKDRNDIYIYLYRWVWGSHFGSLIDDDDDDDDCFYIALFSALDQTHCARLLISD